MNSFQFRDAPVYPSKILCVGRNFSAHIEELGNETPDQMVVFIKPNSALGSVLYSNLGDEPLHYETELCFMLSDNKLAGVGVGLDLTKRELQSRLKKKGLPWERAKAFDGAVLLSDFVPLEWPVEELSIQLKVDGSVRQSGTTELMLHKPSEILRELQSFLTLEDGDILMTGTPAGVGAVKAGEHFTASLLLGTETLVEQHWIAE